ncbi:unnamed protein product, partial [Aphanomyces euteiches]
MHRAEKTSSKICRDRELDLVKSIHHKKLEETRSAIDTSKPKTSSMYHMKRNKRRERLLKEQAVEIHRNNHLLVHRMKDVLECSAWEFHPCTSVNDTSYTVYHSPRSPRKPPGPPPASSTSPSKSRKAPAASLNAPFRSRQLKQIKSENAAHQQRLRQSQTHYKNAQLSKEYKQSVKYLESICAFPLIQGGGGGATSPHHRTPKPPPPLLLDEDDDDDDEDNLLEFYNMILPTIHIPKEPKNTAANGTSLPHLSPSTFSSSGGGGGVPKLKCYMGPQQPPRPRLPSLDPLSPRFKWGPHGAPHLEPTPPPPSASQSEDENAYNLKQCRRIDGVEFVVAALSGQTYGLVLQAHETKAKHRRHMYELFASKDHILELLEGSASSVADEFSVHGISNMLCDKLRYAPSVLSIPLTLPRPSESLQTSIFCRFELVSLADNLPPFVVSMASTEDGSLCFTTEHPTTQESHRLIISAADIMAFLKSHQATPGRIETLEDAAVAALPFLNVAANGRLTLQVREKTAVKAKPEPCPSERAQAAATIQATMRAAILRKLFLDKKNAVHVIKTTYLRRLHQAKRAKKRQHQPIVLKGSSKEFKLSSTITAAVTIQRFVRGFLARHMVHEALERQRILQERLVERGVRKIQAHVRGANVRRQSLRQYSQRDKGEAWPQEIHVDATAAATAA